MKYLKQTAQVLVLIGGLNWGLYGVTSFDLVDVLLGDIPKLAGTIYVLIGLSALYTIFLHFSVQTCSKCPCSDTSCCESQKTESEAICEIKKEV